jgi:hypothetical protein
MDLIFRYLAWLAFGCFYSALVVPSPVFSQTKNEKVAYEAESYFQALISNMQTYRQGDVLIHISKSFDSTEEYGAAAYITQDSSLIRFVYDYENDKYLLVINRYSAESKLNPASRSERLKRSSEYYSAKMFDRKSGVVYDGSGSFNHRASFHDRLSPEVFDNLLSELPEPRGFGFSSIDGGADFQSIKQNIEQRFIGNCKSIYPTAEKVRIQFEIPSTPPNLKRDPSEEGFIDELTFDFDPTRLIPIRAQERVRGKNIEKLTKSRKFEWQEFEGIFAPDREIGEFWVENVVDGVRHEGYKNREIQFHWYSFNRPLDESVFDPDRFRQPIRLLELIQPPVEDLQFGKIDRLGD